MLINYAILRLLSAEPMSGYDLKKIMQDSLYMYWSGNNNQIYKALLQLCSDDLLTSETQHREGAPTKKLYKITAKGRAALQEWVVSAPPEAPEFKKPFLIQLACAGKLEAAQVEKLIFKYQQELNTHLLMQQEKQRRMQKAPSRKKREKFIEDMIFDNIFTFYQSELQWTQKVLQGIRNNFREESSR
jgi:DNA-binding PadR family transcriptional regulator